MSVSRLLCDPNGAPRKLAHKLSNLPHKLKYNVRIFFGCGLRRQTVFGFYTKKKNGFTCPGTYLAFKC